MKTFVYNHAKQLKQLKEQEIKFCKMTEMAWPKWLKKRRKQLTSVAGDLFTNIVTKNIYKNQ